jgi:MerR family transcriptional regulator/heat shock protein HspR
MSEVEQDRAVYSISVTSELSGVNPQMLRAYEQRGLLRPFRTGGGTRRYSRADLDRISDITTLLRAGLNLAGVKHVLKLREQNDQLQTEVDDLRSADVQRADHARLRRENRELRAELAGRDAAEG